MASPNISPRHGPIGHDKHRWMFYRSDMPEVLFTPNLEIDPWSDLHGRPDIRGADLERMGLLPDATEDGSPGVAMLLRDREDGTYCIVQVSLSLFDLLVGAVAESPIVALEDL